MTAFLIILCHSYNNSKCVRKLRPGIKVLLTSGFAEAMMRNAAHFHEGMELLGKPYRKAELARKILDVLGRG